MFSLRDLRFVLCSRDLDMLRAQRIIGFFILITHKSTRSEKPITWFRSVCIIVQRQATLLYYAKMADANSHKLNFINQRNEPYHEKERVKMSTTVTRSKSKNTRNGI